MWIIWGGLTEGSWASTKSVISWKTLNGTARWALTKFELRNTWTPSKELRGRPWRTWKKRQKTREVKQPLWRHIAGRWYKWNQTQLLVPLAGIFPSEQGECARAMWVLHRNRDAHTSEGRCPVNTTSVTTHSKNSAWHTLGAQWIVVSWLPDPSFLSPGNGTLHTISFSALLD